MFATAFVVRPLIVRGIEEVDDGTLHGIEEVDDGILHA